jgi:hypothetical protein
MKLRLITILIFLSSQIFSQEKYAFIVSPLINKEGIEKIKAKKNIDIISTSLSAQGFKPGNISTDTSVSSKESFFSLLNKTVAKVRKGDFVLLYFDLPITTGQSGKELNLSLSKDGNQNISLIELQNFLSPIANNVKDPNLFFSIFDTDIPAMADDAAKKSFSKDGLKLNCIFSSLPGEKSLSTGNSSLFAKAMAAALTTESSFVSTYTDLLSKLEKFILLYTTKQHPALFLQGTKPDVFNNLFVRGPVYFTIKSQADNSTVEINAGQNINILPGTIVKFYPSNAIDTAHKLVAEGKVISSSDQSSVVRLSKPQTDAGKNLWAYVGWNESDTSQINPLTFNTNFTESGNTEKTIYFNAILNEIKSDAKLSRYVQFVTKGGDFQINDIGLMSKDSISCTIINPRTGTLLKDFFYSTKTKNLIYDDNGMGKYSEVEDFIIRTAEWQYLSKLHNNVPELQLTTELNDAAKKEIQKENGFPIVYENDEMVLSIHNPGSKKIFFTVIDLKADKSSKLIFPGLGESASSFFVLPGQTFTTEPFTIKAPFGLERFKIITSLSPIEIEELRQKNILTREKESGSSFFPEYANVQDYDFEIRSNAYARESSGKKITISSTITKNKLQIKNPSGEKIFFNLLKQSNDGSYSIILPDKTIPAVNCNVSADASSSFGHGENLEDQAQLISVYADRPFVLSNYETENKSINELLVDIIRSGKIPGSPLNKITLTQQVLTRQEKVATRGNNIIIKLVSPRISNEREGVLSALSRDYSVNGFALTEDNKPVKTIMINGEKVEYDESLKFFDKIISLSPGKNKIVIEAFDAKGFSGAKTIEVELQKSDVVDATARGINYFLGIGIDDYKVWPQLFNAKNDVTSFSNLLAEKFGYNTADVRLLLDTAATRKNIIKQIRSFLTKVKPNDNVVIYFSGHGNKDQLADGDYYFIPYDGDADDVSSDVKSTDIIDNFKNIRARHCLLIIDACFSGLIANSVNNTSQKISVANSYKNPEELPSKWIITSGRATKVSDGEPGTNSPFASVMINYLKENNDESLLKISKLISFLKDNVPKFNKLQTPFGMSIAGEGELTFKISK